MTRPSASRGPKMSLRAIFRQAPPNTGKGWSASEEESLLSSLAKGTSMKLIASEHQRSKTAIRARLIKLCKISEFDELS